MRLLSFLGAGDKDGKYGETTYYFAGKKCRTNYVAHALASFLSPQDIQVFATDKAWELHGTALSELMKAQHLTPNRVSVPTGGSPEELWKMFGSIVDVIRTSQHQILLDITHGFRMQPFFAAACIQYVQAVVPNPPAIRVVYGEYRGPDNESPIWELTPFLEVLSWSRSLMMFLRTGQADAVVDPTERLGRELSRQWATSGQQGTQPQLRNLANALRDFSNDFTTIRTGALLLGDGSSAQRLRTAIDQTRDEVAQHMPALRLILEQVQTMVHPLVAGHARLSSATGQRVLLALARLYQQMGRYSEATSILREGWITLNAPQTADHPGPGFQKAERDEQERQWQGQTTQSRSVSEIRNDIQHAGFNQQPHDRACMVDPFV